MIESIQWNPAGSDRPRRCRACRYRHNAVMAAAVALGPTIPHERRAEAEEVWRLVQAVAGECRRLKAKARGKEYFDEVPLAEAVARLVVAVVESDPWTVYRNCSCTRGGYRPRRARRRARA